MGLPRQQRLRRTADYIAVRQRGRSWPGRFLILATLEQAPPAGGPLAGFTVTRGVGPAVVRNRVRRRLREIVREFLPRIRQPVMIVTIPRRAAADAEFAELRREWEKLARRAGILPPPAGRP